MQQINKLLNNNISQMILKQIHASQTRQSIMSARRNNYNKLQTLVKQRKFDQINIKELNKEKDIVIQNLNNYQTEQMIDDFSELSFYQEKYMILIRFMGLWTDKNFKRQKMDQDQINKIIVIFQQRFETDRDQQRPLTNTNNLFKEIQSFPVFDQKLQANRIIQSKSQLASKTSKLSNVGLGSAIFQFFEKKQQESKTAGFKDLIQKNINSSTLSKGFIKKPKKPNHDVQIKKLLQQNKRLHNQLQKRAKQDTQLNQFQKNVLREQRQRCMKRIQQLQQQVQQLACNNYKLKQIQKQRSKKGVTTFINQDSVQTSKNQYSPYYIPTRKNDLQVITQKNKLVKQQNERRDNLLLKLVNQIPPIEKKQQYSFDYEAPIQAKGAPVYNNNNILEGLLQDNQEMPKVEDFVRKGQKLQKSMPSNFLNSKNSQNNFFSEGMQANYNQTSKVPRIRQNQSIDNGSRFQSFSIAQTAYNNSSLFMNASKNQIEIDSITSTRNKVAFFKNSLVIYRDQKIQIAYKKSDMDSTYSQIRLIFYINNKTDENKTVRIQYDYQTSHYNLRVTEKLIYLKPNQQGRQVIQINLLQNCTDLNSVIDAHFSIGQKNYDLWVPACLIQWVSDNVIEASQMGFMTIQPDRQFCNYQSVAKLLPLSRKIKPSADQTQAFLFGRSKFGNHQVKLTWWQKQLTIDASLKILDFLGFIMHHFK